MQNWTSLPNKSRQSLANRAFKICINIVLAIAMLIISYFLLLSVFSTTMIDIDEHSYLVKDNAWINLLFCLLFVAFITFLRRSPFYFNIRSRINEDECFSNRCRKICLLIILILSIGIVLCIRKQPRADQMTILSCADQWLRKDFSSLELGGYLQMYQNQLGIVLILYFFSFIFGSYNYVVFQLANTVFLTIFYYTLVMISDETGHDRLTGLWILIGGIAFLPLLYYTTYVYGTIIGLTLVSGGILFLFRFCKSHKWYYLLFAACLLILALLMKQNYLIFLLGTIIILAMDFFHRFNWRSIAACIVVVVVVISSSLITNSAVKIISGLDMEQGISSWSFIAMGLQENSTMFDGWYNDYNRRTFVDADYNAENQAETAKKEIQKRISVFKADPLYTLSFFAGKNASQWNNPNFQCYWINQCGSKDITTGLITTHSLSIISTYDASRILNIFQVIILVGSILYIFCCKEKNVIYICFLIILIGGFTFHTFWEAKGQYTLPYFILLLPLAVDGWIKMLDVFSDGNRDAVSLSSLKTLFHSKVVIIFLCLVACSILIQTEMIPVLNALFVRYEDTDDYKQYLADNSFVRIKDGTYYLNPLDDPEMFLSSSGRSTDTISSDILLTDKPSPALLSVSKFDNSLTVEFLSTGFFLDVRGAVPDDGTEVWSYVKNDSSAQQWKLQCFDRDSYLLIYNDNMVLCYSADMNRFYISQKGNEDQIVWKLTPAKGSM